MNRKVIANWKMNFSLSEAIDFCRIITERYYKLPLAMDQIGYNFSSELIIAAPSPYLAYLVYLYPHISFAAQDVSDHETYGAFTGEISAKQLHSCGVNYCIIGHMERRLNFGEDNALVKRKSDACINAGITPIICLGDDVSQALRFDEKCIIAYEPKESIGTGVISGSSKLEEVFGGLKSMVAKTVNLVYGGSVNSSNLLVVKSVGSIDSIMLGGASLKIDELEKILNNW